MIKGQIKTETYFYVGLECSNRGMYEKKQIIWDSVEKCFEENDDFQEYMNDNFTEKCDYEGDLEMFIYYYSRENELDRKVWQSICEGLNIEYCSFFDAEIRMDNFSSKVVSHA